MVEVSLERKGILRWSGAIWMALFLFWLPLEDFGAASSVWLAAVGLGWFYLRWWLQADSISGWGWIGRGIGLGVALPLAVTALVVVKAGVHGHGFPDVSLQELLAVIARWPWWLAGGTAAGLLAAVIHKR